MKNLLMGLVTCALIMTSCAKNDVIESITDGQGQLSFSPGVGKQATTKVAELNNIALQGKVATNGIVLNAYQNVNSAWSKWYSDQVVYTEGNWKLKTSVRFRNTNATKYLTYFSEKGLITAPTNFDDAAVFTNGKYPQFTYTVAENSADQEDLIAGITEVIADKTDITLGMRHILSQVNFGTVGYKGANIQIRNIKIVNVANTADFIYGGENIYPIGNWSVPTDFDTEYDYYNYSNAGTGVVHTLVPADATSGDKYIFGDGGNAGPGLTNVLYPDPTDGGKWKKFTARPTGLENSLMLLPQPLTDAKVTFEYQIKDKNNGWVAGNASTWEKGEFSLDFTTGTTPSTHYLGKWEQNYRYVYLIDFTDFLNGIALTFKVDVDMHPWENYNNEDGIVDVISVGQPTAANMDARTVNDIWYIATQSKTAPNDASYTQEKWAQVMRNETWDLRGYDFMNIDAGETFILNFQNVIFNTDKASSGTPTTITMTLPNGYTVAKISGTIVVDATAAPKFVLTNTGRTGVITITNPNYYNDPATLKPKIAAIDEDAQTIYYKGIDAVDLTSMDNATLTISNTITVKFTSSVIPTVGATTNGLWTWNAVNKTATWTKVTWNNLADAKSAVSVATANTTIYCSDETTIVLATELEEPTSAANLPVKVIFSKVATRTAGTTANGAWSYNAANKTATWTKN